MISLQKIYHENQPNKTLAKWRLKFLGHFKDLRLLFKEFLRNFTELNSRNFIRIFLFFHLNGNYVIRIGTRQDRHVSMREFSNRAVLSMSDSTMAVSSKYTQDLSVQIVFFTFSCKWFLCFYFWAVIWSYIVDLFAALHELASASARTLLKLASSVRAL